LGLRFDFNHPFVSKAVINHATGVIAAIEVGREIGLMPSCLECTVGTRLKLIPLKPELPPIPVGAVWRKASETELVKKFIAAARQYSAT
jgi:DNA-binding transcriptional LysR family regulator